jgi:ribosome biogenesis GTPase
MDGPKTGTVLGKFRHEAIDKNDFPKVGDWVTIRTIPGDSDNIVIEKILPRLTQLARQEIWPKQQIQILATNIDYACIVIAPPVQPKLGQIERFVSIIMQGKAQPIIILNKTDLSEDTDGEHKKLVDYFPNILVCTTSAETGQGLDDLRKSLTTGSTITFVGESGVGKSSLINLLLGTDTQTTGAVRAKDSAGKHTKNPKN